MKSTSVRNDIFGTLRQVKDTGCSIDIQLDGKVVARLTLNEPLSGIPAMRIKTSEAQKKWSELLNYVYVLGARVYFRVRFTEDEDATNVYMVRPAESRNYFDSLWKAHRAAQPKNSALTPEAILVSIDNLREALTEDVSVQFRSVNESLERFATEIHQKINIAFAGLNRPNGDLQATPELGLVRLRSVADFEKFECD